MSSILFTETNGLGVITLNRPEALNSLNDSMVQGIRTHLLKWREDPEIHAVILRSSSDKAFCAGGDLKEIYRAQEAGDAAHLTQFIETEYEIIRLIAEYPKPYISLIPGICMGGGMGISIHGTVRVVTEDTIMAMPEVNIGYFPDVGASYFLSKCPGKLGLFLGLTAYRMNAADAVYVGIATHYVSRENMPLLFEALMTVDIKGQPKEGIHAILEVFSEGKAPMMSELEIHRNFIDTMFGEEGLENILAHLKISKNQWRHKIEALLATASPSSLKATYELLENASGKSFHQAIGVEVTLAKKLMHRAEFHEGIRAMVVDKDRNPRWEEDRP